MGAPRPSLAFHAAALGVQGGLQQELCDHGMASLEKIQKSWTSSAGSVPRDLQQGEVTDSSDGGRSDKGSAMWGARVGRRGEEAEEGAYHLHELRLKERSATACGELDGGGEVGDGAQPQGLEMLQRAEGFEVSDQQIEEEGR